MIWGFEQPWLAGWLGLALLLVLMLSRGRVLRHTLAALRTLALVLLGLALAGLGLEQNGPGLVILTDVSDSASQAPAALDKLSARARLEFAGRAGAAGTDRSALEPNQTDLAVAFEVAKAKQASRVLLVSDGNVTRGDALLSLPSVPVDVLPLPSRPNAHVLELLAPANVSPGQTVRAMAVLETTQATRLRLLPNLNGRVLSPRTLELPAGRSSVPLEFVASDAGDLALTVQIQPDFLEPLEDNTRSLSMRAVGQAPVLVLNDPAMARLLRTQGFVVREAGVEAVHEPFNPPAVVLRGAASAFSPSQQRTLERYVQEGGGLLMTGSAKGFGLGGWARSPVEGILPVKMDLRTRVDVPLVAMVMVVDRSLSMVGGGSGSSKLGLALEGVANVVELASEQDRLGLVTFSDTPKWVFKLVRANEANKAQMFRALEGVQADGGTILAPAYLEALQALRASQAAIKHLILLTDGQLYDGDTDKNPAFDFASTAKQAKRDGITISSIGVGDDADGPRLKAIAKAGGGRYYAALEVDQLPRIFATEALTATRSLVRLEGVQPKVWRHPLWPPNAIPPRLSAYVATTLQSGAEPILEGLDKEPILAVARKGLGRSAALTFDLNHRDALTQWPQLPARLGTLLRWLEQPDTPYRLSITSDQQHPGQQHAVVEAVTQNQYLNNQRLELQVAGQRLRLEQTAPGRYESIFENPSSDAGHAVVLRSGVVVAKHALEPSKRELENTGGQALLAQIAQRSGGRVLEGLEAYTAPALVSHRSFAPWLALLALLVLMVELAWRRWRT